MHFETIVLSNIALVIPHMLTGDQIELIPAVRYLRLFYQTVHLWALKKNIEQIRLFYADDPNIQINEVGHSLPSNSWWGSPEFYQAGHISQYVPSNIYACGIHARKIKTGNDPDHNREITFNHIPFCFYDHMRLKPAIYWNYFQINESSNAHKLLELLTHLKSGGLLPYVFTHTETGYGSLFPITCIEKHAKISHQEILFIDPNKNHYSPNTKFYEIAQKMVGHHINDYTQVMIHAQCLYLSDSSFFCLAIQLGILTENCYYRSRGGLDYSYLWSPEYGFNHQYGHGSPTNKKIFKIF